MNDLLYPLPCRVCGGFYDHKNHCHSRSRTGVAERILFEQISAKHNEIVYEQENKLEAIKEHIKVMIKPTTNRYTVTKRCKEILKLIEGEK